MASAFQSGWSYREFRREITRKMRFIRTSEVQGFLDAVRDSCKERVSLLPSDSTLWRAQLDHIRHGPDEAPNPCSHERMKPLVDRATEGRVNPKGIPCLYLAQSSRVALGEVRPWIGSIVSMASFRTLRELRVIDCSRGEPSLAVFRDRLTPEEQKRAVWGDIDSALSEPVERSDDKADYVATQAIAEVFKAQGYDGVVYKSAFGTEHKNVALFDLNAAEVISVEIQTVKSIRIEPIEQRDPRFAKTVGALSLYSK